MLVLNLLADWYKLNAGANRFESMFLSVRIYRKLSIKMADKEYGLKVKYFL